MVLEKKGEGLAEVYPEPYMNKFRIKEIISNALRARKDQKKRLRVQLKTPSYFNRHLGRDFLVLGTGSTLRDNLQKIKQFARKHDLISIGVNNTYELFSSDYIGFTNRYRFSQFGPGMPNRGRGALLSVYFTDEVIAQHCLIDHELVMWRDSSDPKHCALDEHGIITHKGSVGSLMILVSYAMGARKVYLAGMDGLPQEGPLTSDSLHFRGYPYKADLAPEQMEKKYKYWFEDVLPITYATIHAWARDAGRKEFVSLTPTSYGDYYDPKLLGEFDINT